MQNELKSNVARFATCVQTCEQPVLLQDRFDVGDKTRNNTIQLLLQQYFTKSYMFFVARFSAPLVPSRGWFATLKSVHYV